MAMAHSLGLTAVSIQAHSITGRNSAKVHIHQLKETHIKDNSVMASHTDKERTHGLTVKSTLVNGLKVFNMDLGHQYHPKAMSPPVNGIPDSKKVKKPAKIPITEITHSASQRRSTTPPQ